VRVSGRVPAQVLELERAQVLELERAQVLELGQGQVRHTQQQLTHSAVPPS
jgi:hypothetical protein